MKPTIISAVALLLLAAGVASAQDTDNRFMREFTENFDASKPQYLNTSGSSLRYYSGKLF